MTDLHILAEDFGVYSGGVSKDGLYDLLDLYIKNLSYEKFQ
jgi:hypothetical protein